MPLPRPVTTGMKLIRTLGMNKKLTKKAQGRPPRWDLLPGVNPNEYPFKAPEMDPDKIELGASGTPLRQNVWNTPGGFQRGQQFFRQQTRPDREMLANIRRNTQRDIENMVNKWEPWAAGQQRRLDAYDRILGKARIMERYPHSWRQILARQPRQIAGTNQWEARRRPNQPLVPGQGQWVRRESPGGGWRWARYGSPLARRAGLRAPRPQTRQRPSPAQRTLASVLPRSAESAVRDAAAREAYQRRQQARDIARDVRSSRGGRGFDYIFDPGENEFVVRGPQGIRRISPEELQRLYLGDSESEAPPIPLARGGKLYGAGGEPVFKEKETEEEEA